jgi:hypothetical protein
VRNYGLSLYHDAGGGKDAVRLAGQSALSVESLALVGKWFTRRLNAGRPAPDGRVSAFRLPIA